MAKQNKITRKELEMFIQEEITKLQEIRGWDWWKSGIKKTFGDQPDEKPASDEKPDDAKDVAKDQDAGPIPLFTGKPGQDLASKFYSSIKSRVGKIDKKKLQGIVKMIMKDLSAQLRANGLKVQESQNIYYPLLTEIELQEKKKFKQKKASTAQRQQKRAKANRRKKNQAKGKRPTVTDAEKPKEEPKKDQLPFKDVAAKAMGHYYSKRKKGDVLDFLPGDIGKVPQGAPLHKNALEKDKSGDATKIAQACNADQECSKQYKLLRQLNAEYSKKYQAGGAEAEKAVRTGGRVKPQKGVLNVSQAIGGKLKAAGVDQKTITALIVKMGRPYFQKIFKQRGIENIKIKEAIDHQVSVLVEEVARDLLKENQTSLRSVKISIKRNK